MLKILHDQRGIAPLILLTLVAIGILAFLGFSQTADFQNGVFKTLFSKKSSFAANPGVSFVDGSNNPVTQITSPNVKLQLTSPWMVKSAGGFSFNIIPEAIAQSTSTLTVVSNSNGNLDGTITSGNKSTFWVGNGASASGSYTGIGFGNVTLPKNAKITSAKLQLYSTQSQWITVKTDISGIKGGVFSAKISDMQLTASKVAHSSNSKWDANKFYDLNDITPVIQELVNLPEWNSGNSVALLLKGTGSAYGRKYAAGNGTNSAKLVITYESSTGVPATPAPVATNNPTAAPTTAPTVMAAWIAEDSTFAKNLKEINPFTTNPTVTDYTFSDASAGTKTVYVKFLASNGEEKLFSAQVQLVNPTPIPSSMDHSGGTVGENSHALGVWSPNTKYDTCPSYPSGITSDQQKIDYIRGVHDSYKVKGPDGKWYPTWHPPVDPKTGCKFGHEHGRDPSLSMVWQQVKEYFYFDENKNGVMDAPEAAVSGLPFAYTNEQYDLYLASKGQTGMRHEDHVGHKVEWANDDTDLATDQTSTVKNSGVAIQKNSPKTDTGVRCYFLAKPHQGVSTKDAFTNNIHEVFYFQDCRYAANPALNAKVSLAMMEGFGAPGGFTSFMPLCGVERRSSPQDLVCPLGKDASGKCIRDSVNQNYPADDGDREIITRECIEKGFLVPQGSWSGNLYEAWPASLQVVRPNGTSVLGGINLLFDVEDANRYYYPGKPNNVGYTMELCYDQSLASQGRIYRGGPCDYATKYGAIKDITWDDPRSAFTGTHRGMYFQPAAIDNAGGATVWYTDPFGKNASTTPFAGSVKQIIEPKKINYSSLINAPIDPRVNARKHDNGNGTVHAPN